MNKIRAARPAPRDYSQGTIDKPLGIWYTTSGTLRHIYEAVAQWQSKLHISDVIHLSLGVGDCRLSLNN